VRYVTKRLLVVINRMVTELTGGLSLAGSALRAGANLGFVDRVFENSVFGEPIYPDIFHQAAAYMFYVIKNHSFNDGNKRTGLAAAILFLEWNQHAFAPLEEDEVFTFTMEVAAGVNDPAARIPEIAAWLQGHCLY
jgi:death on curing protein